jgi:nucleoside 2-deoxyribosyltransferase
MKIYVASSWRNTFQAGVVAALRQDGHEVYDFMDSEGFGWEEVDPDWKTWTAEGYIAGLSHPAAERGYNRDMKALRECDICVYVMPCGVSASLEMGWAVGAGKKVIVYIPELREPDLMIKMADRITTDLEGVLSACELAR